MNAVISPNSNVVHEAEAQRQYARLKLPAKISYRTPQGQELEAQLLDLSVGGFGAVEIIQRVVGGKPWIADAVEE